MLTYLTDTLGFSSTENGTAILIMLIASIPGAFVAGRSVIWLNPIRSCALATLLLTINTIVVSLVLTGVGQVVRAYILFAVYGIGIGWKWTTDRLLASLLIPAGQDAELMGVYLFAGQVMSWLPPLVYTILNEFGVSQSLNVGVLSVYFTGGFGALLLVGNYEYAIEQTGR
jgi:MFS transporter, UMF1 family